MTEQWTDDMRYRFTEVTETPERVQQVTKECYDFVNRMYKKHEPGDLLSAFMNTTVAIGINNAEYYEMDTGEVLKMMVHYFMDALKHAAPEKVQ